jgi:FG-GAP-like repeat
LPPIPYPSEFPVPRPQHSAIPHLSGPLHPTLLQGRLWAVLACSMALTACGGDPAGDPEADGPQPVVLDAATQKTLDSIFMDPTEAEIAAVAAQPRVVSAMLEFVTSDEGLPKQGTWREHPLLADFDGDGFPDLVATNREEDGLNIWRNDGKGGWEHSIEGLPRDLMYGGTDAADLDEDGDLDLIFGAHQDPGLHVFFNEGDMRWKLKPVESIDSDALLLDVTTGDLNGDGHIDVIGIGQFDGGIAVHLGDGKGGLKRVKGHAVLREPRRGTQVELEDLDGDGLDDIIAVSDRGLRTIFSRLALDGSLTFENLSVGLPRPQIGNSLRGVAIADFDEDGDLDLASGCIADPMVPTDEWNYLGVYRRADDGSWEQFDTGLERRMSQHDVLTTDVDLDGHADLVCVTSNSHAVVWLGDGTGGFSALGHLRLPGASTKSALGDIDRDGRDDVVFSAGPSKMSPDVSGITVYLNRADAIEEALENPARPEPQTE